MLSFSLKEKNPSVGFDYQSQLVLSVYVAKPKELKDLNFLGYSKN